MRFKILIPVIVFSFVFYTCKTQQNQTDPVSVKKNTEQNKKSKDNTVVFINALKEKTLGNDDKAIELFKKCLEIDQDDAASHYELSKLYNKKDNIKDALRHAEKAVEIDPENKWYRLSLSRLYRMDGQQQKSIEQLEELVAGTNNNVEYLLELATSYLFIGDDKKAIGVFNKIEEITGVNEQLSLRKKNIYLNKGEDEKAITEIEKLIEAYPKESKYYSILAETYMSLGMEEKALETYKEILRIDPENPYIHISLSDYYRKKGKDEKAYEELKRGFANPKLDIDTKVQILLAYYSVSELYNELKDQAFELAELMIEAHPDNPKAYSIYGDLLYQQDEFESAREAFHKVVSLDSTIYAAWEQLLFVESELNNYESMYSESKLAIGIFPQQPMLYLFNALASIQMKNYEKAVETLKRGLNFVVDNNRMLEQFYSYLGDAYYQLHDYENSDEYYEKVLEINPLNSLVLNNYAYYLSLRDTNLIKAEKMAEKAVELDSTNSANLDTYAWVLYKLGKYKLAKEWIEKAKEAGGGTDGTIMEHYGDILYKLGNKSEAILFWKKARELGENSKHLNKKIQDGKLYE